MHIIEIDGVPSTSVDKFVLREDVRPRIEDTSNNASYPDIPPITVDWSKIRPVKEITDAEVNALTDKQMEQLFADYYAEKARDPLTGIIDVDGVPTHVTYLSTMEPYVACKFMAFDDYKPDFPSTAAALQPAGSDHRVTPYGTYENNNTTHASLLALTESGEGQSPNHDVKVTEARVKVTEARVKVTGALVKVGAVALGVAALAGIAAWTYRKFA